jgi:hypothetical protein
MSEETNPIASVDDDGTIKLDLRQNAVQKQSTDEVPVRDEPEVSEGVPAAKPRSSQLQNLPEKKPRLKDQ